MSKRLKILQCLMHSDALSCNMLMSTWDSSIGPQKAHGFRPTFWLTIWVFNSYSIVLYHKNSSICLYWHKACSFEIWIWGCWKNSVKISTIWTPMYHLSVYKCKSARSGQSVQVWEKQLTFLYQQICSGLNDQLQHGRKLCKLAHPGKKIHLEH